MHGPLSSKVDDTVTPPPAHFARDCALTRASFVLTGLAVGLAILMGVAAGVGVWFERSVSRQRGQDTSPLQKVDIMAKYPGT